jgi:hypothetical protein
MQQHYTLFGGAKGAVCQCNDRGMHSEMIVLGDGELDMNNLKFPPQTIFMRSCGRGAATG